MYAYKAIFPGNSVISCYEHICAWINYIKVVDLRKSDYRHNFRCKCGFCQGLSQFQECVCCSEIDCCLWSLKTMKRLRQRDSSYLHNTSGVTVICVSPCYVYPHTHIPSDMCIPRGGTINTDAHQRHNKEKSSLAKENAVDII